MNAIICSITKMFNFKN